MKHLNRFFLTLGLLTMLIMPVGTASASSYAHSPAAVVAAGTADACDALGQLGGTQCQQKGGNPEGKVGSLLGNIVNIISYIAGAIAVIMIIVAGVRYTTSGGDANSVSGAKSALVYALVGVAVAALAQILVHLVLNQTNI